MNLVVFRSANRFLNRFYRLFLTFEPVRVSNPNTNTVKDLMEAALQKKESVFFIQVGSNDGVCGDPLRDLIIRNPHWKGIFIEPVPFVFERLKNNYAGSDRFTFENVAIGRTNELRDFFYLSETARMALKNELPAWFDQLGSFEREHIEKHFDNAIAPFIVSEKVQCLSFNDVIRRNRVDHFDLLHIDTEGFDYEVLKQVDFSNYHPKVVLFEHKHLASHEKQQAECLLKQNGYSLFSVAGDTLAMKPDLALRRKIVVYRFRLLIGKIK